MFTKVIPYIKAVISIAVISYIAMALSEELSRKETFRGGLIDYIEEHSRREDVKVFIPEMETDIIRKDRGKSESLKYNHGDWEKFVISQKYRLILEDINRGAFRIEEESDVDINSYGAMRLNLLYGKSKFTKGKYKLSDEDKPVSRVIQSGFNPEHEMRLHVEGHVGKRLTIYIDHDSRKRDNRYIMKYRAIRDEEIIREINAGEIDIKVNNSKYAVYDDTESKGIGIDVTIRKDKFTIKGFGSVTRGETEIELFMGNSSPNNIRLSEYQYVRNTYYQIEPFKRYDNLQSPPSPSDNPYTNLITFTSSPAAPETFIPYSVNADPSGFELYMDDQNPYNNFNAVKLSVDGGYYTKLMSGADYVINYATGLITMLRAVPDNARIFAVYTLNGGTLDTSDPSARFDVFSGKIFVFIKYSYSIDEDVDRSFTLGAGEDKNGDGKLNLDIYEVRSIYRIGEKQLLEDNFKIQFYRENGILIRQDIETLGKFSIDYSAGIVRFNLREPFKRLLGDNGGVIYSERQPSAVYLYSLFKIHVDYFRESRSFQLKHFNIIQGSVRIKINGRTIPSSMYTLDYTSGFLQFTDPDNPVITDETEIEVRYEYLPFAGQTQNFVGGFRGDYHVNRYLDIGGTLLYTRTSSNDIIPNIGSEPEQVLVLEGDTKLHLGSKRIKRIVNKIPGVRVKSVPVEINAYAEYARSYRTINTFGKALIDDMESSDEIISVSLSDRDWILSSMPEGAAQDNRGLLNYYYYRNLSHSETLKGLSYTPYEIQYSTKPGPYNVATGHVSDSIRSESSQRSLVFDFDFSTGDYVSAVTRNLSSEVVDFSTLQYVELWYRSGGGSGEAELFVELGRVNEDADGDGSLDTEDNNYNGFLDTDPSSGIYEDRGYRFNPAGGTATWIGTGPQLSGFTMGDGILNSEDLDANGMLDSIERIVGIPGDITAPYDSANTIIINLSDSTWKKVRIYIDKTSAAYTANPFYYEDLLKQVESIRLYLKKRGAANVGTVFIDSMRFVSSRWKNIKLDDVPAYSPNEFSVTIVDTISDEDYRAESFMIQEKDVYTSIHGERNSSELSREREAALSIDYNLSARAKGSVARKFLKPMDLRFYKTMNVWFNFREFSSGDEIGIKIGSSENDYIEYRFSMEHLRIWRDVSLKLRKSSSGSIKIFQIVGNPDRKRISFMEIVIYGNSGKFWVNDIYVSDPIMLKDSAYWYEGEIKFKRPLYITNAGVPIISDIKIKYIQKGHGSQFSTVGKTVNDVSESYKELFSSLNILPNWSAKLDFIFENSKTDSLNEDVIEEKRGETEKQKIFFESDYRSNIYAVPSIKLMYKQDDYENLRNEYISSNSFTRIGRRRVYTPALALEERLNNLSIGSLTAKVLMDMLFKEENVKRSSENTQTQALEQLVSLEENEKRQKGRTSVSIDYQNKYFFVSPTLEFSSHEIVTLSGKSDLNDTEILDDVNGDYHFPFINDSDFKFVERSKKGGIRFGLKEFGFISPEIKLDLYYSENKFRDYDDSERLLSKRYSRAKDARSYISNRINLPILLNKYKSLKLIRNLSVSYSRSLYFQESEIPYEGEKTSAFNEQYGINRVYNGISDAGLNLYRFPPWYFFRGRGNYANGRDYSYNKFNECLNYSDENPALNYNNSLRLIDNFSWSSTFDLESFVLNYGGGVNQISERQAVSGIPQQVVSIDQNVNINFDIMQIVHIGFFRPNRIGTPYHSANLNIGYGFKRNMLITSNIEENVHTPGIGITFKRDRASLGFRGSLDYRRRNKREYISLDESKRGDEDDIFVDNMQNLVSFKEVDKGYNFSVIFETDVIWIYRLFSYIYELAAYPIFSIEYSMLINRHDYTQTVSPEPYDQHLVTGKMTMDLHKNIQGGLIGRWALEKFRNRDSNAVYREIISYEVGFSFTLLF